VENGCSRVLRIWAGPLQATLFQTRIGDAPIAGGEAGNFVHNLGGVSKIKALTPHPLSKLDGNQPVRLSLTNRGYRLPYPLYWTVINQSGLA